MRGFVKRKLDATGSLAIRNSPGVVRREATGMPLNTNPPKAKTKTVREHGGLELECTIGAKPIWLRIHLD